MWGKEGEKEEEEAEVRTVGRTIRKTRDQEEGGLGETRKGERERERRARERDERDERERQREQPPQTWGPNVFPYDGKNSVKLSSQSRTTNPDVSLNVTPGYDKVAVRPQVADLRREKVLSHISQNVESDISSLLKVKSDISSKKITVRHPLEGSSKRTE